MDNFEKIGRHKILELSSGYIGGYNTNYIIFANINDLKNIYGENNFFLSNTNVLKLSKNKMEYIYKKTSNKYNDELISKLSKEIFEARYNEFMEVVDTILKEELNKVYTLKDLYSGKYFFDKSKLEKDDVIGNYPILDDFCLYYVIDKNKDDDRTEILGFYSLYYNDFSEHIGENKDIKSILIGQRNLDEDDFVKAIVDLYEF